MNSLLSNDLYKFTMGQVAFLKFSNLNVKYKFIDRNNTLNKAELGKEALCLVNNLWNHSIPFSSEELSFLAQTGYFHPAYLDWLNLTGRDIIDPDMIKVDSDNNITIEGPWYKAIYWEVPLLSLISENYYKSISMTDDNLLDVWAMAKVNAIDSLGVKWSDFGTRRRFSAAFQDEVVKYAAGHAKNFQGTSNIFLAKEYSVKPIGTMGHEGPMAMAGRYGIEYANFSWQKAWSEVYEGKLGTFLPDTFTTDYALQHEDFQFWNLRQDSGCPKLFVDKVLNYYEKIGENPKDYTIIFSDGLNVQKIKEIEEYVDGRCQTSYGIGTNLTNNIGYPALNIVVKLDEVNGRKVCKLSDESGKATGDAIAVAEARRIVNGG